MATRQGLSQSTFNLIIDTFHFIPGSISEISIGRNTRSSGSDNDMHALFAPLIVREVSLLLHPPLNLKSIEIIFDRFVSSKKEKKRGKKEKKIGHQIEDSPRLRRDSSEDLRGVIRGTKISSRSPLAVFLHRWTLIGFLAPTRGSLLRPCIG